MNLSLDRDDVQAFLATLPSDPERDRRADVLRSAADAFTKTFARKPELTARQERVANALVDAPDKERARLITEHGNLATEISTLPTTIRVVTSRFAEALVAWGTYTCRQVIAAHDDAVDQIAVHGQRRRHLADQLTKLESATMWAEEAVPVRAEYDALKAELRPHYQRRDQAADVARAIEHDLRSRFGDDARGSTVEQAFIDRYVTGVTKAAA